MKIGILGSGNIGGTLGTLWVEKGHQVMFSSRHPQSEKMRALLHTAGENAQTGSVLEAIDFGEVILLAVPGSEIEQVLGEAGDFQQKILINSANLLDGRSAGVEVLRLAKNARVVRAFNTVAWEVIANPQYGPTNATLFINGDDPEAKAVVARLGQEIGFDSVDAGDSATIPNVEKALGMLWRIFVPQLGREYTLRVLRRDTNK